MPCSCVAQFYALGVPASDAEADLDVYVAIAEPPETLRAIASGRLPGGPVAARVTEAVILESLIHAQRLAGLVSSPPFVYIVLYIVLVLSAPPFMFGF